MPLNILFSHSSITLFSFSFARKFDKVVCERSRIVDRNEEKEEEEKRPKRFNICSNCKAYRRNVLNNVSDMISISHSKPNKEQNLFISVRIKIILDQFHCCCSLVFFSFFCFIVAVVSKYITQKERKKRASNVSA